MGENMTLEEMVSIEIDKYTMLLRIKKASKEENTVLNHEIKVSEIKLQRYGYNDLEQFQP